MASPNGEAKNRNSRKHFPQGKIRQEKGRKGDGTVPFFFLKSGHARKKDALKTHAPARIFSATEAPS
jgi:hypothetical protein